jgi:cell division protein FtsQ
VRVGGRRWNLRIDDAIDVMLPEENAESAWSWLAELERTSLLLKRDVQTVDLRLPDRLVLRVSGAPPAPQQSGPTKKPHAAGKPA